MCETIYNKIECKKEEEMNKKVEPFIQGKFYKTKGGKKVVYVGFNKFNESTFPHIFAIEGRGYTFISTDEEGLSTSEIEDIEGEWHEKVTLWVAYKSQFDKLLCETEGLANTAREKGYQVQKVKFKGE